MSTQIATISCTITSELNKKLNFMASIEERSKSYYVKKALQEFLNERLENALLAEIGYSAYQQYLDARKKGVDYDDMK
jgi:predicted DNA-binding protein